MRLLALLTLLAVPRPASPCSAFLSQGEGGPILGKGYDWTEERALVLVNKRGVEKRALVLSPRDTPASWRSRFASLSFNQYGRELPNGGINEAGVVVEVLMLPESRFPPADGSPVVTELGLVQYLLDQAASTAEAVTLAKGVRVAPAYAKVHYFVCDAGGACATLEMLDGRLVATSGDALKVRAITNSTYADSRAALAEGLKPSQSSLGRFVRLARGLDAAKAGTAAAWTLLDGVRFKDSTQWNVVYELGARRVHWRSRNHPTIKTAALDAFAKDCAQPVMALDMLLDASGEVSGKFSPYESKQNLELVRATLAPLRGQLPSGVEALVAAYPETLACRP